MSKRELSPDVRVVPGPTEPEHIAKLRAAKAKIADPQKWVKGGFVRYSIDLKQSTYCLLGSLGWGRRQGPDHFEKLAAWALADVVGPQIIADFNDAPETTHADVMAALDLAIEKATNDWLVGGAWLTS